MLSRINIIPKSAFGELKDNNTVQTVSLKCTSVFVSITRLENLRELEKAKQKVK